LRCLLSRALSEVLSRKRGNMRGRSTRNRIRWSLEKAAESVDHALESLAYVDLMQGERSPLLNAALPPIVVVLDEAAKALRRLRDGS
jgi:hypothetical protein